ncbi:MAG: hypothetical protein IJA26_07935 [Clostridia bacterium]|nr:hypothetical protein [Clostridia bacterium]
MKFVHGRSIPGRACGSGIMRIVFGSIMLLIYLMVIIAGVASAEAAMASAASGSPFGMIIMLTLTLGAGGALLLFFGIRAVKHSLKGVPMRDPNRNEPLNPMNPFFTATCPSCATRFDYQRSDLGHRAWYPNGYVDCPSCGAHIRHNAEKNVYQEFYADTFTYGDM